MKKFIASAATAAIAFSLVVPAFAESTPPNYACTATAVDQREAAVGTAVDAYYNSVKSALSTRRSALAAAWAMSDKAQRKTAINAAWSTFKGTWKSASQTMKTARKNAWSSYKTTIKQCHGATEDSSGESADNSI